MLVVIEDDSIINGLNPVFGDNLKEILQTPEAKTKGNWKIYNSTEFAQIASKSNRTAEQEIMHQIHHQKYWASLHVMPNASYNYFNAMSQEMPIMILLKTQSIRFMKQEGISME